MQIYLYSLRLIEILHYLCSVKGSLLTIRAESREGQDFIDTASEQDITDTTPFLKPSCKGWFLSFI
jgi:hypothetical protein